MKILIAVDGSEFTQRTLDFLAVHKQSLGPPHQYTVLTVVPAVPPRAASALDRDLLKDYYTEEAEKVLKPVRNFFAERGMTGEFVFETGHAPEHIARAATRGKYDLVVLGSHGHSALGGLVMGSVSSRVLAECKVPVLVTR